MRQLLPLRAPQPPLRSSLLSSPFVTQTAPELHSPPSLPANVNTASAIGLPKADGLGVPLQDGCQGDSGGPLIFNAQDAVDVLNGTKAADRLAGVVSWGKGCGQLGRAGVFANAALLKDWVEWNADAAPRPSSCPSSANPTATFFLESAARAWSGYKPSSTKKLAATEAATSAAATATCQARCAATINQSKDSCAAFSVTSVTKASKTTYYCSLFTKGVPPRLCDASEKSTVCQQAAVGSWRLKYTYT